jgi:DNA-binding NarL/FixJ family response regulator
MVRDFKLLPRRHFSVLAATLNKDLLLATYAAGGCSYLSQHTSGELLYMTLCLPEEAFLLDPTFASQMLLGSYFDSSLTVPLSELTRREREIFELVCKGATNGSIADQLNISVATVKSHVSHILQKLGVKRRQVKVLRT